jgi:2-methylcitrate dehydratase PrpD
MAARIAVTLHDGRTLDREVTEYPGLNSSTMSWKHVLRKFDQLSGGRVTPEQGRGIADAVRALDTIRVSDLARLLASVGGLGTPDASSEGRQSSRGG